MTSLRLGIDIGGTFTDLVAQKSDGSLNILKVTSTPDDPGKAVVSGLLHLLKSIDADMTDVTEIVHGTTVGSNTILQKAGAKTGLLTTKGFRDVLEIGRIRTPVMFDLTWEKPLPLSQRRHRREVFERINAKGEIVTPLNENDVREAAKFFQEEGVESVAICFLNSFMNSVHEVKARDILATEFPDIATTSSFEVLPEIKEYERTSTTVVNAYLLKSMRAYLKRLSETLYDAGLRAPIRVINSRGGMVTAATAAQSPALVIASGPAGGVIGGVGLAKTLKRQNAIFFDLGGTTAKASLITNGNPMVTTEYEFREGITSPSRFVKGGGYMLKVPAIDIAEVGAGGGSIAWIDEGGLLRVGPRSAGADPGPACYDQGNKQPTLTDANVFLGYLNPVGPIGGGLVINPELSESAIRTHIAEPLSLSTLEAAQGIRHIANLEMARAIRSVTVERGLDPRELTLIASGGAGPVHAVELAEILGIKEVVITPLSGVFCSLGMLSADIEHSFVKTLLADLKDLDARRITDAAEELRQMADERMTKEGFPADRVNHEYALDLRYIGQSSELMIPYKLNTPEVEIRRAFLDAYLRLYGYATEEPMEIVNMRLVAQAVNDSPLKFSKLQVKEVETPSTATTRQAFFTVNSDFEAIPIKRREDIGNDTLRGPMIIEAYDTTIVLPPGADACVNESGSIVIMLKQ